MGHIWSYSIHPTGSNHVLLNHWTHLVNFFKVEQIMRYQRQGFYPKSCHKIEKNVAFYA